MRLEMNNYKVKLFMITGVIPCFALFLASSSYSDDEIGVYRDGVLIDAPSVPGGGYGSTGSGSGAVGSNGTSQQKAMDKAKEGLKKIENRRIATKYPNELDLVDRISNIRIILEIILENSEYRYDISYDFSLDLSNLSTEINALEDSEKKVIENFQLTREHLVESGLSDIILTRHKQMVRNHVENYEILISQLSQIPSTVSVLPADAEVFVEAPFEPAAKKVLALIKSWKFKNEPPLLSDNKLPNTVKTEPAAMMTAEEADAMIAGQKANTLEASLAPPTQEDLDPTIDIQITQKIIDLAASLDNSPLKIYEYVKDNFEFEPYLGSRKGAAETLEEKSGNDYDLSSLLIALFRASNIPARYVKGTVELPIDTAMQWLGVEDGATAGSILTTMGMDGITIIDGGGTPVAVRFSHVWVSAYIPYTNYRGIENDTSGKMWVPVDPSIKKFTYHSGQDILSEMGFDTETFLDAYLQSQNYGESPVEKLLSDINDFLASSYSGVSYKDIIRYRAVDPENLGIIPGSLPCRVVSIDEDYAEIPADKRYEVRFHLYDGGTTFINYTTSLPEFAGKRVTISYIPETPADEAVINSYGDLYSTPPYLVSLTPVLKIDGQDAAVGTGGIGMGMVHNSDMHFTTPVGDSNVMPTVSNIIIAGTYQAIGFDAGRVPASVFMPSGPESTPTTDDLTGDKLFRTAMQYLFQVEWGEDEIAKTMRMVVTKDVSEAIVENAVSVTYSFGTPQTFDWMGLTVDADRCITGPFPVDGASTKNLPYMVLAGHDGSYWENGLFEHEYDEEAVSTVKILMLAYASGIPVYEIDSGNIASILPLLTVSSSVVSAISSAIASGHIVKIPRDNIIYYNWTGTGYVDMDPATGAAGYIISGGQNGGATVNVWLSWKMVWFTLWGELCDTNPITATINHPAPNEYFPKQGLVDFYLSYSTNALYFDVDYTICNKDSGTQTINEVYRPYYPYPAGDYTFYAGWDTGATVDFTIFGVEIETPDGTTVVVGCDGIALDSVFTPRPPPSPVYQWEKGAGNGDGNISAPAAISTQFEGTVGGEKEIVLKVSNTNGETEAETSLSIIELINIYADDGIHYIEDNSANVEPEVNTIYVEKNDTGFVDVKVETNLTSPPLSESDLPADWLIEKVSGTLDFEGTPGKLQAMVKKDTCGDIAVKVTPCAGSTDHFYIKIVVVNFDELKVFDKNNSSNYVTLDESNYSDKMFISENTLGNTAITLDPDIEYDIPEFRKHVLWSVDGKTATPSKNTFENGNVDIALAPDAANTEKKFVIKTGIDADNSHVLDPPEVQYTVEIVIVNVAFNQSSQCSGFDPTINPPWLMVPMPAGSTNTANATIDPVASASDIHFESANSSRATVLPSIASTSPQIVTVTSVSAGNTEVNAKTVPEATHATLNVAVKNRVNKTVAIHAITEEENNDVPARVPAAATLETALNNVFWGQQANVFFEVTRSDYLIDFDLDRDGVLDDPYLTSDDTEKDPHEWDEINVITNIAKNTSADFNIYYVQNYEYPVALSDKTRGEAWVGDTHFGSSEYVTAHEIGHLLGRFGHDGATVGIDLMGETDSVLSPCRIKKIDWDYVEEQNVY